MKIDLQETKNTRQTLDEIATRLQQARSAQERVKILSPFAQGSKDFKWSKKELSYEKLAAVCAIFAIGQDKIVFREINQGSPIKIQSLIDTLESIDLFYLSIGGIVGYQAKVLSLLAQKNASKSSNGITPPEGLLAKEEAVIDGLAALPEMAELYPIGGAGERLQFVDEHNEAKPVALLPFLGTTLLEGLVRDVVAREYLYYKLFGKQLITPLAFMTSPKKGNHNKIGDYLKANHFFGRPDSSIKLFCQPLVPVVTQEGDWSLTESLTLNLQPGGHGAVWQMASNEGILAWFEKGGKTKLLLRQINNPLAAEDLGLLAFLGTLAKQKATFGFASCDRHPGAAEGMLAVCQEGGRVSLRNIEYTEFDRTDPTSFPTNTNLLYANLTALAPHLKKWPLPGLMLNMKTKELLITEKGEKKEVVAGRLESMMQNVADSLTAPTKKELKTHVIFSPRSKLMSTAKRKWKAGKSLLETPEGAYYDIQKAHHRLLEDHLGFSLPSFSSPEHYLKSGPSSIFNYHKTLGPLYSVIAQKIQGDSFGINAELNLDISDLLVRHLNLSGSLLIRAENVVGHLDESNQLQYSRQTGKCILKNVTIKNRGIDRSFKNDYWKGEIKRLEACNIILKGCSEFYAENVTLQGDQTIVVEDKQRVWITEDGKRHSESLETPSWWWDYKCEKGQTIALERQEEALLRS